MEQRLEFLRRDVALRHAAVVAARELLIEALGERMCGGGRGPTPAEVKTFERARQAEAEARAQLERYLVARSQELIEQARCAVPERRTRSRDRAVRRRSG